MQWYPDDWWAEMGLKLCSMAAQGLWFNMLNMMFRSKPRGILPLIGDGKTIAKDGKTILLYGKQLAKILSQNEDHIQVWLQELLDNQVCSVDAKGYIYCRRMKREWEETNDISEKRAEAGRMGAEKRWHDDSKKIAKIAPSPSSPSSPSSPYKIYSHEERILRFWNGLSGRLKRRKLKGMRQTGSTPLSHKRATSVASQRLKEYGYKLVRQAVYNYYRMWLYPKDERRWTYTLWGLTEFCGRSKDNVARFMDWDEVQTNFLEIKKKSWIDK